MFVTFLVCLSKHVVLLSNAPGKLQYAPYLYNGINWTCLLTETTVDTFSHVNVISGGTSATVRSLFSLYSDSLGKQREKFWGKSQITYKDAQPTWLRNCALTLYSMITSFDASEVSCIWKYYGKWSICSFWSKCSIFHKFSKVFKT